MSESPALTPPALSADPPARVAGTGQLVPLVAASSLSVLGATLIAPVLPQMAEHFSDVEAVAVLVPVALTIPALMIGLAAPFAGVVADAVNRKRLLTVALLVYALVGTAPLYLQSLGAILVSRALLGLCEAAIMTSCTTLIGDYWSGARRSRYLAMQTLVSALSAVVFIAVGGVLGASGWRTPFWLYALSPLLAIPVARNLWDLPTVGRRRGERLQRLPWAQLAGPCLVSVVGGILFSTLVVQLSFVLSGRGITSSATLGAGAAVMSVATAAGTIVFGRQAGRTPRVLLPLEFGLTAVGLAVTAAAPSTPVVLVGAVLTGFGTGMLLPTLLTWAVNRLPASQRGRGTGLWTGAFFLGQFLSPLAVAALSSASGGLLAALGVLAAVAVVMAVVARAAARTSAPLDLTVD